MKRTVVFILAVLLLASCSPAEVIETDELPSAVEGTTEDNIETEAPGVKALLPEANYEGASFNIQLEIERGENYRDLPQYEDLTGEALNDAVYERNSKVEELYDVDLVYTHMEGGEPRDVYPRYAMAGDDTYKLYYSRLRYVSEFIGENVARPWSNYPHIIDFEAPWFNTYAIETFSLGDKAHILVGDLNDSSMRLSWVYLFNKKLAESFQLPDLYTVVDEGKWTIDFLRTITQDVYVDENGDGKKDTTDIYGFVTDKFAACDQWCRTIGFGALGKDENNLPVFQALQETTLSGFEKIYSLMWESEGTYVEEKQFHQTENDGMFVNENAVITHTTLEYLEESWMREMTDFGVLPTPKLTEDQEMGYTHTDCMFSCLLLPSAISEEDAVMSATITNALNAFSYEIVKPVYYETVLKTKLTRDENSPRMLDLVMEGRRYSLAMIAETDFPLTHVKMLRDKLGKKLSAIAAPYKANEKRCQTWIENYVATINNIK